jgi:ABC-type antimicrobial peptide transport system permease subunit
MRNLVSGSVAQERLLAAVSGSFGALALILAALGLYGVTSYSVSRRRAEIGIRMALGADRTKVVRLVMRRLMMLLAIGLGGGMLLAAWASRFVGTLLFGLDAHDVKTFAMGAIVLAVVGGFAGWVPARRAARADPMFALRNS